MFGYFCPCAISPRSERREATERKQVICMTYGGGRRGLKREERKGEEHKNKSRRKRPRNKGRRRDCRGYKSPITIFNETDRMRVDRQKGCRERGNSDV